MKILKILIGLIILSIYILITSENVENRNDTPTSFSQPIPKEKPQEYQQFGFDTGDKERDRLLDECYDEFLASDKPFDQMKSPGCKMIDNAY